MSICRPTKSINTQAKKKQNNSKQTKKMSKIDESKIEFRQSDESLPARVVLVHYPGAPNWMGAMHPNGALYETGVDLSAARAEHEGFRRKLESHGCKVHSVYDVLLDKCDENVNERVRLEDLAAECLTYRLSGSGGGGGGGGGGNGGGTTRAATGFPAGGGSKLASTLAGDSASSASSDDDDGAGHVPRLRTSIDSDSDSDSGEDDDDAAEHESRTSGVQYYVSDEYKRSALEKMGNEQLCDIILTNPTVTLTPAQKNTSVLATSYSFDPLVNLIFTRDQSITTRLGVVLTRPQTEMRLREIKVIRFCLQKLGVPIIGEVPAPGTLEGGDFFPAGDDLCIVGVGLRSNTAAVRSLLRGGQFGTRRVAVAKDYFDQSQVCRQPSRVFFFFFFFFFASFF
jgi:arginine deiminase